MICVSVGFDKRMWFILHSFLFGTRQQNKHCAFVASHSCTAKYIAPKNAGSNYLWMSISYLLSKPTIAGKENFAFLILFLSGSIE